MKTDDIIWIVLAVILACEVTQWALGLFIGPYWSVVFTPVLVISAAVLVLGERRS